MADYIHLLIYYLRAYLISLNAIAPIIKPILCKLKITDRCNFRCQTCTYGAALYGSNELSIEDVFLIVKQLSQLDYRFLRITGGEPLLRPELSDIVAYAKSFRLHVSVVSNGFFMSKDLANRLRKAGLDAITISIHGVGQDHDDITGINGSFDRADSAIALLKDIGMNVNVNTTICKMTIRSIPRLLEYARLNQVCVTFNLLDHNSYFFVPPHTSYQNRGGLNSEDIKSLYATLKTAQGMYPTVLSMSDKHINYIINYFGDPVQKHIKCISSISATYIDSHGDVFAGCWAFKPFGNVQCNTLAEILSTCHYRAATERMLHKECPGCSCGYARNLLFNCPSFLAGYFAEKRLGYSAVNRTITGRALPPSATRATSG